MAFLSIDDPDFWEKNLESLQALRAKGKPVGIETSYFALGKPEDNPPLVTPLRMAPGYVLFRHAHDCYRMEIVVQGSLDVGGRILKPGAVMISEPGVLYGPHIDFEGAHKMMLESAAGALTELDIRTPEDADAIVKNRDRQQDKVRGA
jgi:hypothetical protein